jgi:hypothetical protein
MHLERTVHIACPADEIFDFLAAGPRCARWRAGVREIARMTTASGLGAVYRQIVSGPGGRPIDGDYLVTGYDRPSRLDFAVVAGPARPTGSFVLHAVDDAHTQVTFSLDVRAPGVHKLLAPYWNRRLRQEIEHLDRLKDVLERERSAA